MTYSDAIRQLDAFYAELPSIDCQRKCPASCGVILMTRIEWVRIIRRLGYKPRGKPTLVCPMLKQGRCSVHDIRPTICRLWGISEAMPCPFGCIPERWMSLEEGNTWLAAVEALSDQVFPGSEATAFSHGIAHKDIRSYIADAKAKGLVRYNPIYPRQHEGQEKVSDSALKDLASRRVW